MSSLSECVVGVPHDFVERLGLHFFSHFHLSEFILGPAGECVPGVPEDAATPAGPSGNGQLLG